jgi:hypothetical protein
MYRYCKYFRDINGFLDHKRFVHDLDTALLDLRPSLFEIFTRKWSTHNKMAIKCKNNCSKLLVLDGIHKINRFKCMFNDTEIDILELKDPLITGCIDTPTKGKLEKLIEYYYSISYHSEA